MGVTTSSLCCAYCNTRLPTEEDEFLGIRAEVKQKKQKENIPMPFQQYLRRKNSITDHETNLNFLDNPQIDYLTTHNKVMQRSAILDINEIPEIPTPRNESFSFPQKEKRSSSLFTRKEHSIKHFKKYMPLFMPRKSLNRSLDII